ncbi:MAG: hypothetical protein A4S14_07315 [Proteobacteria bacterium SG_bin9]|nr:MAG: hypothetical protein A4S14_07315 [Proteobacteria bacterium SG_bin9]
MNSRVSWSVDGIDPSVRDRAEAAARRAGMSLNDWLNANLGGSQGSPAQAMSPAARDAHDVADIHQRLDSITRQIERLAPSAQPRNDGVARQLNDAISRLDARLNRAPDPAPARPQQTYQQQQPAYQPSPSITPVSLDDAIAEIAARQSQLDGRVPAQPRPAPTMMPAMPPVMAPPIAPPMPDLSGLERQLFNITNQIDALRRPDHNVEESLAAFRAELADIRKTITEAMPRTAIESLEGEIRTLARRIEDGRQSGVDGQALAGIERALGEIYEALRGLTPAEQLAGFDDAIRTLGGKIDTIAHASGDPRAMQQLEGMIDALRGVVTNVASNDALVQLASDVRSLSSNVDQLARQHDYSGSLNALEQRIAMLTTALENREPMPAGSAGHDSSHLESAMRSLSDRIDHLQAGSGDSSAHIDSAVRTLSDRIDSLQVGGGDSSAVMHHLEQRIAHLMERMDGAGSQNNNLARVEDALADILRHLADQRDNLAHQPAIGAPAMDTGLVDAIKRELSDMRYSQSETDRRTQDSLETVHSALGHVADRLSSIEGDLRKVQSAPAQHEAPRMAMPQAAPMTAPMPRPELPNPVMAQAAPPQPQRSPMANVIIEPAPAPAVRPDTVTARMPIDASLPPDHPLEPGSRTAGRVASPSERIAASEDALSDIPGTQAEPGNASSYIAAARRAAQAAASAPSGAPKTGRITVLSNAAKPANPQPAAGEPVTKASRIRSLLVGVSVVVIVLSGFRLVMGMFDGGEPQATIPTEKSSEVMPPVKLTPDAQPRTDTPAPPSMMSPNPINRQSMLTPAPDFNKALQSSGPQIIRVPSPAQPAAVPAPAPVPAPVAQVAAADPAEVTGSVTPKAATRIAAAPVAATPAAPVWTQDTTASLTPISDKLPDAIGSEKLRNAALKGDPAAAYEIGLRYAEGKGIAANLDEAAKWYERAALGGVTPAMFRLGTFYEKGLSVKKNPETARRYYMQAAERGNAKAMHNLAVLDADGGGQGPNYKSAVQWFRKAADHGVADSQFNLGILYARGIGVEQNLAESYKWFSLAAAQGDADSGRKRDDVAKRLDAQSLAAAKLAIQTFVPDTQPEGAANAAAPAGGWDGTGPAAKPAKTAAPKASSSKRAER